MADVFQRAWGNYLAMLEFLTDPDGSNGGFNDQKGLLQLFNFATLLSYSEDAPNYNDFLLHESIDFASPGTPETDVGDDIDDNEPKLEHNVRLTQSYEQFLNVLDVLLENAIDPSRLPEYEPYRSSVREAQRELKNYQNYVASEWRDWIANNPGFPEGQLFEQKIIWERDNGHSLELETLERSIQTAHARKNAWLRRNLDPSLHLLIRARTYFDDRNHKVKLPVAASHESRQSLWQQFHMQFP